jgi:dihydropteroate synthase
MTSGQQTRVMGILNITPDSFSDGGRFVEPEDARRQIERMIAAGVDIFDVGGESTRPFAEAVSLEEELDRVLPVIRLIRQRPRRPWPPGPIWSTTSAPCAMTRPCLQWCAAIRGR